MNDLSLFEKIRQLLNDQKQVTLVTVIETHGHAPGKTGFKMVVSEESSFGTIGGGAIEHEAIGISREMMSTHRRDPLIIRRIHRPNSGKNSSGMICGGSQILGFHFFGPRDIFLLFPVTERKESDDIFELLLGSFGFSLRPTPKDYSSFFPRSMLTLYSPREWLYREMMHQKDTAYIFGGGHVGQALTPILQSIGFQVTIIDPRKEILLQNKDSAERVIQSSFPEGVQYVEESPSSYAFIMTPGHLSDEETLRALLSKKLPYIGMVASKRKSAEILARLKKAGFTAEQIEKVHSPVGIPIKSRSPAEIAISIVAEIIQLRNK